VSAVIPAKQLATGKKAVQSEVGEPAANGSLPCKQGRVGVGLRELAVQVEDGLSKQGREQGSRTDGLGDIPRDWRGAE
jgi:hypothetical protein